MYWSGKTKTAFIRIPKTGSSTAHNTLKKALPDLVENGDCHETYTEMRERSDRRAHDRGPRHNAFPEMRAGARIISFVRHPLDWLPSFFAMLPGPSSKFIDKWLDGVGTENYRDAPDRGTRFLDALSLTPYDWFTYKGKVMATEIWRTEDMAGFCATFQKPWQHINETGVRRKVEIDWTPEDLARIKVMFARELKHYPERPM
jgi:hypothetical protein